MEGVEVRNSGFQEGEVGLQVKREPGGRENSSTIADCCPGPR